MPKGGRRGGHKGQLRQYTSPKEIKAQLQAEKQKARGEEEQVEGGDGAADNQQVHTTGPGRAQGAFQERTRSNREAEGKRALHENAFSWEELNEQAKADLGRLEAVRKKEERKAKDDATLLGKRMQWLSLNK
ncbi:hypothetical protein HPG69_009074 [Diceros bicornis minor]|uniref:Casein kinase substrate phosphoprotein PP28 domain-containing protein n=1 Tax=Diceros bicornis minor TaxID=77932 RepID=A0A7J7EBR8_DICBM|nr:hypothetical protein HPG69_009074 [Diceros bicornis minor]